jgi:hypothetical protein
MVSHLARLAPRRPTEHRAPLASPGMDGLWVVAVPATNEGRSAAPAAGPRALIRRISNRFRLQERSSAIISSLTAVSRARRPPASDGSFRTWPIA